MFPTLPPTPRLAAVAGALTLVAAGLLVTTPAEAATTQQRGGFGMQRQLTYSTVARCTAGFNAVAANGHPVLITAGHCGPVGSEWHSERDFEVVGTTSRLSYTTDDRRNDWAVVRSSEVFAFGASIADGTTIRYVARLGTPYVGRAVCMTGRTSGRLCGKVTEVRSNGVIRTTIVPKTGDSGAPLYRVIPGTEKVEALGILSFSDQKTYSGFQRLSEVLAAEDVRLKTV